MESKLKNAIWIQSKNMLGSVAIKLAALLMFLISCAVSFQPLVKDIFYKSQDLIIYTEDWYPQTKGIIYTDDIEEDHDIEIEMYDMTYIITVNSTNGLQNLDIVNEMIHKINKENLISTGNLTDEQLFLIDDQNIKVHMNDSKMSGMVSMDYNMIMGIIMIFNILIMVIVSRVSAEVAYEKGNMVTEVILTSIPKKLFYMAQVVSASIAVIFYLCVIAAPMIVANFINDTEVATDFSTLSWYKWILVLIHLMLVSISLIILGIGLGSMATKAEDSNLFSLFLLIPLFISYIYFTLKLDIFHGIWYWLNYVPFVSVFPVMGGYMNGYLNSKSIIICCFVEFLFVFIELILVSKMYCKNIIKR